MGVQVQVLGIAQDGGVPQAGCHCATCAAVLEGRARRLHVAALAVRGQTGRVLLVDATPDLPRQVGALPPRHDPDAWVLDALALTHAHMGHYLGLAHLGREAMHARNLPVHATPAMAAFLRANRPWSHLVERRQIDLVPLELGRSFPFDGAQVVPFPSPHRSEDTDTVGFEIRGAARRLVYVPDADRFDAALVARIRDADVSLVDGTFYDPAELPGRDLSTIPHPFVAESVRVLAGARGPVHFTHLNHSNALLHPDPARRPALPEGFAVAEEGAVYDL